MTPFEQYNHHLVGHSLVLTLLPLVPIPLLDLILEPYFARRMFSPLVLDPAQTKHFIGRGGNFCLGCIWSIIIYPFMKLIKLAKIVLRFQSYVQSFYYWYYKGYLVVRAHELLDEDQLLDHALMQALGTDIDTWLRSPECKKILSNSASATFDNISQMIRMYQTWHADHTHLPLDHLMQHQTMLDKWFTEWRQADDSPE